MANIKSAAKRARQTAGRTLRNKSILTGIRSQQKKLAAALGTGDSAQAQAAYGVYASRLDKAAKRGAVHPNLAARRKSRAAKALARVGNTPATGAPVTVTTAEA